MEKAIIYKDLFSTYGNNEHSLPLTIMIDGCAASNTHVDADSCKEREVELKAMLKGIKQSSLKPCVAQSWVDAVEDALEICRRDYKLLNC